MKIQRVSGTENRIEEEQPAEEEDLGKEEDPHPHLGAGIIDAVSNSSFVRLFINHIYTARARSQELSQNSPQAEEMVSATQGSSLPRGSWAPSLL